MEGDRDDLTRRSVLQRTAASGAGAVAGVLVAGPGSGEARGAVETVAAKEAWAASRAWCLSGNRLVKATGPGPFATTTTARQV
ncbi:MAG: hypothetical protein FJ309_09270 [Planctomycetes bacterium]|nr:hypothetical protein [Planctomycetota bacterium]